MEKDEEKVVFNAMVKENEMIICIAEYREMEQHIKYLEELQEKQIMEKRKILTELENAHREIHKLTRGIINCVKSLGG